MSLAVQEAPRTRTSRKDRRRINRSRAAVSDKSVAKPASKPEKVRYPQGLNWGIIGWLALLHVGALAAPFFFSWSGLVLMLVLHWVTGGIGICLGYHRMLTHGSFSTYRPVKWLITLIGGLAGEGPAIHWVADHRKHHAHSDEEGDPHSPTEGAWWSHVFWVMGWISQQDADAYYKRWVPDLLRDPVMAWICRLFLPAHFVLGIGLFLAGMAVGGWWLGLSWLMWGLFARVVFVLHSTWFVNSASHMWGYTNYETKDESKNNWWVALITYGEGWHNNHHAYPRLAAHGHRWWEIDVTYTTIRVMRFFGLAWNVSEKRTH